MDPDRSYSMNQDWINSTTSRSNIDNFGEIKEASQTFQTTKAAPDPSSDPLAIQSFSLQLLKFVL
jgi:hypothetical protein